MAKPSRKELKEQFDRELWESMRKFPVCQGMTGSKEVDRRLRRKYGRPTGDPHGLNYRDIYGLQEQGDERRPGD